MWRISRKIILYGSLTIIVFAAVIFAKDIQRKAAYFYATIGADRGTDAADVQGLLATDFDQEEGVVHERRSPNESGSRYWWLNSGGEFIVHDGIGSTVEGELDRFSKWRIVYNISNAPDTDEGRHPQNLFRLISRSKWLDVRQEIRFRVTRDNISSSPNRNESNGVVLMSRYVDENNLYYAGLRVDGAAVIKRKKNGAYETLAYKKVFEGTYDRESNPSLLPKLEWITMRSVTQTLSDGGVLIELWQQKDGEWEKIAEALDVSELAIRQTGHVGTRSDFMDVQFDDIRIEEMNFLF
ncbi:hypothetical protein A2755_03315 [Candidatus Wolfebacteria bacterium RIFCSPHIGHO2_01_FULL_48_22]|uniref:Uncharacterized protein n=2 Tax=Candidatus Wolfeibacteriota TaxID=1752735 RepID=A0A1F8DPK7_9BACT|nr:MAG: hypothetical protein A2755_03315 [Candidatus Wolfebacteria bacterium RIFCSPHIGHO2_01_FULL_48_22]OGM92057.1 MAG: hypothetical protein A2935_01805 [Candidatus Wolfebacteria bacterium RIFCSPLOWO2_01_FULL_47_17b]